MLSELQSPTKFGRGTGHLSFEEHIIALEKASDRRTWTEGKFRSHLEQLLLSLLPPEPAESE
jgi:hypothetical protein